MSGTPFFVVGTVNESTNTELALVIVRSASKLHPELKPVDMLTPDVSGQDLIIMRVFGPMKAGDIRLGVSCLGNFNF